MGALVIPQAALDLVKKAEGCYLDAYLCPAGKWTIGYGHTGPEVGRGLKWTQSKAEEAVIRDLLEAAVDVNSLVRVPITLNQRGALASFVFNLGATNLKSSTMLRLLNAGNYQGAVKEFPKWVNATVINKDGSSTFQPLPGLVKRRKAEAELFDTP